jgi:hypothetical protein
MSAILTTCPGCGAQYLAVAVGAMPWPAHQCVIPIEAPRGLSGYQCQTCRAWVSMYQTHSCAGAPPR